MDELLSFSSWLLWCCRTWQVKDLTSPKSKETKTKWMNRYPFPHGSFGVVELDLCLLVGLWHGLQLPLETGQHAAVWNLLLGMLLFQRLQLPFHLLQLSRGVKTSQVPDQKNMFSLRFNLKNKKETLSWNSFKKKKKQHVHIFGVYPFSTWFINPFFFRVPSSSSSSILAQVPFY